MSTWWSTSSVTCSSPWVVDAEAHENERDLLASMHGAAGVRKFTTATSWSVRTDV
jgi:hypothetical protein